jgi:hypothetical protein
MPATSPNGRKALDKKRKERADLKDQDIIWVGIAATEANLQRLGVLMLLADFPMVVEPAKQAPLPYEETAPPELEIDYTKIRNAIIDVLQEKVKAGVDKERLKDLIARGGGTTVKNTPNDNLLDLLAELKEIQ